MAKNASAQKLYPAIINPKNTQICGIPANLNNLLLGPRWIPSARLRFMFLLQMLLCMVFIIFLVSSILPQIYDDFILFQLGTIL